MVAPLIGFAARGLLGGLINSDGGGISVDYSVDSTGFDRRQRKILKDQLPFANALALTRMAQALKGYASGQITARFDRPKRFTTNALFVKPAKKNDFPNQSSAVFFREFAGKGTAAGRYLHPSIVGKARTHKRFEKALIRAGVMRSNEYAMPGRNIKLDGHGNVRASLIVKMLSQLRAGGDQTQFETATSREAKRSSKTGRLSGARFFVSKGGGNLPRGIYSRTGRKSPVLVFIFVTDTPDYKKIYPFDDLLLVQARRIAPTVYERTLKSLVKG